MPQEIPEVLGRCRIKQKLGEGAKGKVYLGEHMTLQIPVAVKIMNKRFVESDAAGPRRFVREARIAARLHHPNIVRVYDCGRQGDLYYLVMDFIEGENCQEFLQKGGTFDWPEAVRIAIGVARGLGSAAENGVIHRDVKPDNIMVDSQGVPLITDLGVAKWIVEGEVSQTRPESVLGTPLYLSPEHVRDARNVDLRSDIYSLGASLYHMVVGSPPFEGPTVYDVMVKHLHEPLASPNVLDPSLPPALCDVIAKSMAKDPDERYQTYEELIADLEGVLAGQKVEAQGAEKRLQRKSLVSADSLTNLRGGQPLQPAEVPFPSRASAATVGGYASLVGTALALMILFHALRLTVHPAAALALLALAVPAYVVRLVVSVQPAGELVQKDAGNRTLSRMLSLLEMLTEGLHVPRPQLYIAGKGRPRWQGRAFLGRWFLYVAPGAKGGAGLTDTEMAALLAQQVGRYYYGHTSLLTVLGPVLEAFGLLLKPFDLCCQRAAAAAGAKRRTFYHLMTLVGLALVLALLGMVFLVWFWGGVGLATFLVFGLLGRNVERHSTYASDVFAAVVLGSRDAVKGLIAAQVAAGPRRQGHVLQQAGFSSLSTLQGEEGEAPSPDVVARVVTHYSERQSRAGFGGSLCELLTGEACPGRRINALAGLKAHMSGLPRLVRRGLVLYGSLLGAGGQERARFVAGPARARLWTILGLAAGALISLGVAWPVLGESVPTDQGIAYLRFVVMVGVLGAAIGWMGGRTFARQGGTRQELTLCLLAGVFCLSLGYVLICGIGVPVAQPALLLGQIPIVFALALLSVSGGTMVALRMARAASRRRERAADG